ncbi:hypothetical protein ABZ801_00195 [Actinomadura sp. NPDC047616]|uniref:hypothetical protein n=1 Tax=Actinomadura sp. NPDC047616 TaxID=3155914 RepID=UPI0034066F79
MNESGAGAAAPMSREGVDHALRTLREEHERIADSLLEVEAHQGFRLLKGAVLTGETWRRWDEAQRRIERLWLLFDACQQVVEAAERLRARRSRPDPATLAELSELLAGPSVEAPESEIPLERRTLLGPDRRRLTLGEAVALMSETFDRVVEVVAAADAAWTALLVPLDEVESDWREAARLAQALDGARRPEVDRLGRELTAFGQLARTDPLSLVRDGRADTSRLDRLRAALDALRESLGEAVRLKEDYERRVSDLRASVDGVAEAELLAARARDEALEKIAAPVPPEPGPSRAAALREQVATLDGLRRAGRWTELVGRVTELDAAARLALEQARDEQRLSTGLLDRRGELRGRLEAYRAKAARLGLAEDDGLTTLYKRARDLLWSAPCDLRRATVAVADYQRAIKVWESEAGAGR